MNGVKTNDAANLFARLQSAGESGLIFFYSGFLSQSVVSAMGDGLRFKLEAAGTSGTTARKVFSSFIEMAQNILHYASAPRQMTPTQGGCFGSIGVFENGNGQFSLLCANAIPTEAVERLRTRLEQLRTMSRDEVRAAYREQLRGEPEEGSKGAGLGFLTLARDASEAIEFDFTTSAQDADLAIFHLRTVI